MASYLVKLDAARDVASMLFLDEALPETSAREAEARTDEQLYKVSLGESIKNTILVAALHEVGHIALHHLDRKPLRNHKTDMRDEAEADGFAVGVLQLANMPSDGGAVLLVKDLLQESVAERFVSHPPAVCRIAAFSSDSYDWVIKNSAVIEAPSENAARDELAAQLLKSFETATAADMMGLTGLKGCADYTQAFF